MRTELMGVQYLDCSSRPVAAGRSSGRCASRATRARSTRSKKPLHLGAVPRPGPSQEVLDGYSGYGLPLGEAFQLRDDVLGVFGDPSVTASRPATTCARASAPCWWRWPRAADARPDRRHRLLGDPRLDLAGVDRLREVMSTPRAGPVET
jgi:geranylgeranyl diphosphate synthase type I